MNALKFNPTTVSVDLGGTPISIETGRIAKQAAWLRHRPPGRHHGPRGRVLRRPPGRHRLLPPDRGLPRARVRRRQDPRRLVQARGPAHHQGNPHHPPHRPPPAAPLRRGLQRRHHDHRPGASATTASTTRHPRHGGRLRGPHHQRDPLREPRGRRPRGPRQRPARGEPHRRAAHRQRHRPAGGRHRRTPW